MKIYVRAFAITNKAAKDYLISKTPVVIDHLIKVLLYPDVQEQNHWKKEIASALNTVPAIKSSNRKPKPKFIYENTFDAWKETIEDRICAIVEDIVEVPIAFDISDVYHAIGEYFEWLSDNLSYSTLKFSDIYSEIESIRNKWMR